MLKKIEGCALWVNPHDVSAVVIAHERGNNSGHTVYVTLRCGLETKIWIFEKDLNIVWNSLYAVLGGPEKPGDERL